MASDAPAAVVELTLPSDPRYLALVRVVVAATAGAVPSLADSRVADLKLVATELFANAMEANWRSARMRAEDPSRIRPVEHDTLRVASGPVRPEGSAPVEVTCRADASGVTLVVSDSGPGLDATDELHPPVEDPDRLIHERGLGIPLIQYLADKVDYESDSGGTRATVFVADRGERRSGT